MPARKPLEYFLNELQQRRPDLEYVEGYAGYSHGVTVKSACGHIWNACSINKLFHKHIRCPICKQEAIQNVPISHDDFCYRVESALPHIKIVSTFIGYEQDIKYTCLKCGRTKTAKAKTLLDGNAKLHLHSCNTRKHHIEKKQLINCLEQGLTRKEIADKYGCSIRVIDEHVAEYNLQYYMLKKKKTEELMRLEYERSTQQQFINKIKNTKQQNWEAIKDIITTLNPVFVFDKHFINTHSISNITCKSCNYQWQDILGKFLEPQSCPKCGEKHGSSFIENFFFIAFSYLLPNDNVLHRNKNIIDTELDIYIPNKNFALEYGSWYYHKKENSFNKDKEKRKLCRQYNITLITIYDMYTDKKVPFNNNCYTFDFDLSREPNLKSAKNIIEHIALKYLNVTVTDINWQTIINIARVWTKGKTQTDIERLVYEIQPDIEILGPYVNMTTPIKSCCLKCGHIWNASLQRILYSNCGCPKCADRKRGLKRRKTYEDFVNEVSNKFPNITIISKEYFSDQLIQCRCDLGHEWSVLPTNLLTSNGCPMCSKERRVEQNKQIFQEKVEQRGNAILLSEYQNSQVPVTVQWIECGHIEQVSPHALLYGKGCIQCNSKKPRMTQEKFEQKVHNIYPDIEILSEYQGFKKTVKCTCKKHPDVQLEIIARRLLAGKTYGCPKCAQEKTDGLGFGRRFLRKKYIEEEMSLEEISEQYQIPIEYLKAYIKKL